MPAAPLPALNRLLDLLLTTDPVQRLRLTHTGLALLLMALSAALMQALVAAEGGPALVRGWTLLALGGVLAFYGLIRSGATRHWRDPALTLVQVLHALVLAAAAYAIAGALRGAVLPALLVVLGFGMFALPPRTVAQVSLLALALLGTVMAAMAWLRPRDFPPGVELGHFLMLAALLPAASLLAARVARMRARLRRQKHALARALALNRERATHDEATGLINRRHMRALLEQERQRSVRSGRGFCVALLAVQGSGPRPADAAASPRRALAVAHALQEVVRLSDLLGHGDAGRFVLLLSNTRLALARHGIERLRVRVAALPGELQLQAALVEHLAGESVAQTLQRAERALHDGTPAIGLPPRAAA